MKKFRLRELVKQHLEETTEVTTVETKSEEETEKVEIVEKKIRRRTKKVEE